MTALNQLTLDADGTIDTVNIEHNGGTGSPYFSHCNDAPDGVSSDFVRNDAGETTGTAWFRLTDVNADFGSMNSLNIDVDVEVTDAFDNDTCLLTAQIFDNNADETNPLTDSQQVGSHADSTRVQRQLAFGSLTGSKAQWNAAHILFTWTYTKVTGPDNARLAIYGCDIDGDYTISALGDDEKAAVASAQLVGSGGMIGHVYRKVARDYALVARTLTELSESVQGARAVQAALLSSL